jgi:hypothetical protein
VISAVMNVGVLALDDEVGNEEQILGRELPAPVLFRGARNGAQEMLERDSQKVGTGDLFCARRSLCSIGQGLRKPDRNQNCFCHHQTLRKGPGGNCAMPVLGDPPMLGKQRHPGRAAYYIVIPHQIPDIQGVRAGTPCCITKRITSHRL